MIKSKKVAYDGYIWGSNETKKGTGILTVDTCAWTVEFKHLTGPNPSTDDLLTFVLSDKTVRAVIKEYQKKGRVKDYAIRIKQHKGINEVYINFYYNAVFTNGKYLLYSSCFKQTLEFLRQYIGDFVEMVVKLQEEDPDVFHTNSFVRKHLRSKSTFMCEKTYNNYDIERGVSNIIYSLRLMY